MPNTINIVQPKAEDGVTEVSFVTRTNSIYNSDGTPIGDIIKCKTLSTSVGCTYQDAGTVGYRSYAAERVVVSSISGYPTGSTILAVIPVPTTWNNSCIPGFDGTYIGVSAKVSGTYNISVVVIYI